MLPSADEATACQPELAVAPAVQVTPESGQASADVVLGHRAGLWRLRKVGNALLEELETSCLPEGQELIRELVEVMSEPDDDETEEEPKRRAERMRKTMAAITGLPNRIDSLKKLSEINERIRKGEREAFGIDSNKGGEGGFEDLLRRLGQQAG